MRLGAGEQQDAADEPRPGWRLAADLGVVRTPRALPRQGTLMTSRPRTPEPVLAPNDERLSESLSRSLRALREMERRAAAALRAGRFAEADGQYETAVGFYLDLAREQRFIAQQRARGVAFALGAAAECSLAQGRRRAAEMFVRPLSLDDGGLIRADQGLHTLLGVSVRRLRAMGIHDRVPLRTMTARAKRPRKGRTTKR